jgi:hypothetical protein
LPDAAGAPATPLEHRRVLQRQQQAPQLDAVAAHPAHHRVRALEQR